MPVTLDSLRDEYAAAAEQMAGRALDVLAGGGGTVAFPDPLSRAELAAVRVLGPDLFAPALFAVPPLGDAALGPRRRSRWRSRGRRSHRRAAVTWW